MLIITEGYFCQFLILCGYRNDPKFSTDRFGQTVQTQIRLLLEEQSDQGLHYLLFHLYLFDKIPQDLGFLFKF